MALRAGFHGTVGQPSAQVIDGSLRFDSSKKNYLTRIPSSVGNKKTFTFSTWTKGLGNATFFCNAEASTGNNGLYIMITADSFYVGTWTTSWQWYVDTNRLFRDDGWYHLVVSVDTTISSPASDRVKLYVNGVQETSFATANYPSQDYDTLINNTAAHAIGRQGELDSHYLNKKLSQVYFIDGQQLGPENFGFTDPLTNTWRPKKFSGSFTGPGDNVDDWIGMTTGTQFNASTSIDEAFDGASNSFAAATGNSYFTFTPTTPITGITNVRLTVQRDSSTSSTIELNDVDISSSWSAGTTATVTFARTTLSKVKWGTDGSNQWFALGKIEVEKNGVYYTLIHGKNGFYLPMDGNSSIGEDKSGNGNDYKPVNFGGSNSVDKATGALPILNTVSGGNHATVGVRTDANASNLFLALPLVGTTNDESNKINSGSTTKIATNSSVTASTTQSNFYGGSHHWNSNTDSLLYAQQGNDLVFGTGDFTIEFWFYDDNGHNGNNNRCVLFDNRRGGNVQGDPPQLVGYVDSHNEINLYYANGSEINITVPSTVGKWWHYAAVRSSGTTKLYIDGVEVGSASDTTNYPNNGIALGSGTDSGYSWSGYIQDFRVYKTAKYTSNFAPASTNPDILPDTPSGVSGGSKLTKITDGAVAFDGSGDYLSATGPGTLAASSNWCMECFFYCTGNSSGTYRIMSANESAQSSEYLVMRIRLNQYQFSTDNANSGTINTAAFNKWTHMAFTKEGTTVRGFIDGVKIWETTDNNADSFTTLITGWGYGGEYFPGFISNARFVNGSSVYTADFTPPPAPLTNITNTYLLCCQSTTQAGAAAVSPNLGGVNDGTVWSSFLSCAGGFSSSAPAVNAFNGDNTNKANNAGNSGYAQTSSFDNALIFAPSTPLTNVTKIEILTRNPSSTTAGIVNLDTGSGYGSNIVTGTGWTTVYDGTAVTLNKIRIVNTYHGEDELAGIKINDTLLLDPISVYGDAAATNFNPFTDDINTVRGQETGYATWNPLSLRLNQGTLTDGNLTLSASGSYYIEAKSNFDASKFDNYSELTITQASGSDSFAFGIAASNDAWIISGVGTYLVYRESGAIIRYPGNTTVATVSSYTAGDVLGMAIDSTNVKFYKNGILQGTYAHGYSKDYFVTALNVPNTASSSMTANFGQKPFKYAPPDGFQPTNAANNRPVKVISRPDQFVGITTWSGTSATHSITGLNFNAKPDLVLLKERSSTSDHGLWNSVMGQSEYNSSNSTQGHWDTTTEFTSFDYNGFTLGNNSMTNDSGQTYVAWCWKAGGSKNTFNVDDVGYASASDVGMNVDALSNKTQNWSGNATGGQNVDRAFDGTGPRKDHYSHTSGSLTVNFSPAISGRIIVYGGAGGAGARTFTLSDGSSLSSGVVYDTAPYYSTLDFGVKSNITSLTCSNGYTLYGISLDGKMLVDSGLSANVPSIAPTGCSVGTKQGFSIIKYEGNGSSGATLPHGLTQAPDFAVVKNIEETESWGVYHSSEGGTRYAFLNSDNAFDSSSALWNNTDPTSSLFFLGDYNGTNKDNIDFIAYLWHDVPGLQKFGSYTGNGDTSDDGPFIELGFRPAIIWFKRAEDNGYNWNCYDTTRSNTGNPTNEVIRLNLNNQEETNYGNGDIDVLANGFKIRNYWGNVNASNKSYIYCAWAEAPTFNLYGGQSNAR